MVEMQLKLAPQCRMMNICGIDIIGNPETNTIIGLNDEGMSLIQKMKSGDAIDASSLNENQNMLLNELSAEGFFTNASSVFAVKSTYLHVTSHCNLRCSGCYSFEADRNAVCDLTLDELKKVLDNLVDAGLTYLTISGGEPFSREDLEEFLAYAKSKRQIQYIECITNGTASLNRYQKASQYIDKLSFSLDSADAESAVIRPAAVFKTVVDRLIPLQAEGSPVSIIFTIHHGNVARCSELMVFANSMNVEFRFSLFAADNINTLMLTPEDYEIFHKFIMSHQGNIPVEDSVAVSEAGCIVSCGAGKTMISVASDGSIYPCHMFVNKKQFAMGNALYDNIKEIINNSKYNSFCMLDVDCIEHCKECSVRYLCGGGCRFRAFTVSGNIGDADPMCKIIKDNKESYILRLSGQSH